jgi:hypothetical protein
LEDSPEERIDVELIASHERPFSGEAEAMLINKKFGDEQEAARDSSNPDPLSIAIKICKATTPTGHQGVCPSGRDAPLSNGPSPTVYEQANAHHEYGTARNQGATKP